MPKTLSYYSFDEIPINRSLKIFLGNGHAHSAAAKIIGYPKNGEELIHRLFRPIEDTAVGSSGQQPPTLWKPSSIFLQQRFDQGVRRARPFARRALITLRPLRVAMRALNPCVRARLRLLG